MRSPILESAFLLGGVVVGFAIGTTGTLRFRNLATRFLLI